MMENTQNSELSSYTTPEGGTEEKKVAESEEVVFDREDDSAEKKKLEDASKSTDKEKNESKESLNVENNSKGSTSDSGESDLNKGNTESKEEETDKISTATEETELHEPQPQPEATKSGIDTSSNEEVIQRELQPSNEENSNVNPDKLDTEAKETTTTKPQSGTEDIDTEIDIEIVSETTKTQGDLQEGIESVGINETPASKESTGDKEATQDEISVDSYVNEIKPKAKKGLSKAEGNTEADVEKPDDKSETVREEGESKSKDVDVEASNSKEDSSETIDEAQSEKTAAAESSDGEKDKDQDKDKDFSEDHNFSKYTLEQIVDLIKKLARYQDLIKAEKIVHRFKSRVDELKKQAREEARKKFISEGGEEKDFSYKPEELFERIDANTRLIHDRRHTYIKDLERQKEENLAKAEVLLERLREFLDGSESSSSFKVFKEIQTEWKTLGPLPGAQYKSLWANYNALVNRFYDTRSIYFELKELDRKKNLEYKGHLCEKAESLEDVKDLKHAIMQLNELHDEFKHTGPVPLSDQEPVWQRFKAASDKVYARRKVYNTELKHELKENLQIKSDIAVEIQQFQEFSSDKIREWNTKTREVLELQKKWEKVGGLPREKAKEINKKFWSSFKTYFHNKNEFFKKLDGQRSENLKIKEELVKEAEGLKNSEEWDETAKKLKALQEKWKEIGPVPEKVRNEVYMKFKAACDYFFNSKREKGHSVSQDYIINLEKKKALITEIKGLEKGKKDIEKLKELQYQFYEIGFVPKSEISNIQNEYNKVLNEFIAGAEGLDEGEKQGILLENRVEKLRHSPNADKKIHQKEYNLKKQIGKIENDISIWKNNMEFFANTKNAEKLKSDFNKKIVEAAQELERLKKELRVYKTA